MDYKQGYTRVIQGYMKYLCPIHDVPTMVWGRCHSQRHPILLDGEEIHDYVILKCHPSYPRPEEEGRPRDRIGEGRVQTTKAKENRVLEDCCKPLECLLIQFDYIALQKKQRANGVRISARNAQREIRITVTEIPFLSEIF